MTEQDISENDKTYDANSQNGVEEEDTRTESNNTPSPSDAVLGSFSSDEGSSYRVDIDGSLEVDAEDVEVSPPANDGNEDSSSQNEADSNDRRAGVEGVIKKVNDVFKKP